MNTEELDALLAELGHKPSHKDTASAPIRETEPPQEQSAPPVPVPEPPQEDEKPVENVEIQAEKMNLRERLKESMTEETALPTAEPQTSGPRKKDSRFGETLLGLFLVIFALIGVFSTVTAVVRAAKNRKSADSMEMQVADAVLPLVVMDCPMFGSTLELSDEQMLTAGIWSLLTSGKINEYAEEMGYRTVPAADVEAEMRRLFFMQQMEPPQHQTIGAANDLHCYYDAESDSYRIPTEVLHYSYTPKVTKLEENLYTGINYWYAEVEYLPDQPAWQRILGTEPTIGKTVKFTLVQENQTQWRIFGTEQLS